MIDVVLHRLLDRTQQLGEVGFAGLQGCPHGAEADADQGQLAAFRGDLPDREVGLPELHRVVVGETDHCIDLCPDQRRLLRVADGLDVDVILGQTGLPESGQQPEPVFAIRPW